MQVLHVLSSRSGDEIPTKTSNTVMECAAPGGESSQNGLRVHDDRQELDVIPRKQTRKHRIESPDPVTGMPLHSYGIEQISIRPAYVLRYSLIYKSQVDNDVVVYYEGAGHDEL